MLLADEIDGLSAFASANEAVKPMKATDSANASTFLMSLPFPGKKIGRTQPGRIHHAYRGEFDLLLKTPMGAEELQEYLSGCEVYHPEPGELPCVIHTLLMTKANGKC
jgi:hypothetical protein